MHNGVTIIMINLTKKEIAMKLELKNVKHSEFASHETFCYEANLYVDGKPFAYVSNDGKGGSDRFDHDPRFKDLGIWKAVYLNLKRFCASEYAWESLSGEMVDGTIETACSSLMTDHLIRKDLNKALRKPCYLDGNQIVSYKVSSKRPNVFDQLRRQLKKPDLVFLNELPKDEAFKMFKEGA